MKLKVNDKIQSIISQKIYTIKSIETKPSLINYHVTDNDGKNYHLSHSYIKKAFIKILNTTTEVK